MNKVWLFTSVLLLMTASILTFMVQAPIQAWDEARRGINALRILQENDWWNYRYLDDWDTFNTKPPLFSWLVALSFKLLGVSKFSLRLPSLIALSAFLVIVYRFMAVWKDRKTAILLVWILLLTKGIVGYHVALHGDTDILFILLLTTGLLAFFYWWEVPNASGADILVAAAEDSAFRALMGGLCIVSFGLAFLVKGVAIALILPGVVGYGILYYHDRPRPSLTFYALFLLLGVSVLVICWYFGRAIVYPPGISNLLEAMLWQDGLTRFTDGAFEKGYQWDYLPTTLDIRFSPWIYLLYAGIAFTLLRRRTKIRSLLGQDRFLQFSLLIILSVSSLLLLSQNKHQWYVAPMLLFLAYPVTLLLRWLMLKHAYLNGLVIIGFVALTGGRAYALTAAGDDTGVAVQEFSEVIVATDTLLVAPHLPQDLLFNLYVLNPDLRIVEVEEKDRQELSSGNCSNLMGAYCLTPRR